MITPEDLPIRYSKASPREKREAREAHIKLQENKCWHCEMPLTEPPANYVEETDIDWAIFPPGFRNNPVHLHHNHNTDWSLGAVHMKCNAYLWQILGE